MSLPVRWKLLAVLVGLPGVTLVLAAAAAAGNAGLAPEDPATSGAEDISRVYFLVAVVSGVVLLAVLGPLLVFIVRYRGRGRALSDEGPQVRGNTRLEIAWTLVPVVFVAVILGFVLYEAPGIELADRRTAGDTFQVDVQGRRFYWQYVYPNGVVAIDRLRIPTRETVNLNLTAPDGDVIHSFWVPKLGGKFDAIPGQTQDFTFRASEPGVYEGVCGEYCGVQHAAMQFEVEAMEPGAFRSWLAREGREQEAGTSELGRREWEGVCAKCHRLAAGDEEQFVGPNLAAAQLSDVQGIEQIVRNGQGAMPAVAEGWSERQLDALTRYLSKELAPQSQQEGSSGEDGG